MKISKRQAADSSPLQHITDAWKKSVLKHFSGHGWNGKVIRLDGWGPNPLDRMPGDIKKVYQEIAEESQGIAPDLVSAKYKGVELYVVDLSSDVRPRRTAVFTEDGVLLAHGSGRQGLFSSIKWDTVIHGAPPQPVAYALFEKGKPAGMAFFDSQGGLPVPTQVEEKPDIQQGDNSKLPKGITATWKKDMLENFGGDNWRTGKAISAAGLPARVLIDRKSTDRDFAPYKTATWSLEFKGVPLLVNYVAHDGGYCVTVFTKDGTKLAEGAAGESMDFQWENITRLPASGKRSHDIIETNAPRKQRAEVPKGTPLPPSRNWKLAMLDTFSRNNWTKGNPTDAGALPANIRKALQHFKHLAGPADRAAVYQVNFREVPLFINTLRAKAGDWTEVYTKDGFLLAEGGTDEQRVFKWLSTFHGTTPAFGRPRVS